MPEDNLPQHNEEERQERVEKSEEIIPEPLRVIFDKLPEPDRRQVLTYVRHEMSIKHSFRKGPLPKAEELAIYNTIIPDGANRIMKMAENQAAHRIAIEDHAIRAQLKQSGRGQDYGLIIAVICLILSFILALHGNTAVASILGGSTIIGLVTIFALGKKAQKKDSDDKK